MRIYEASITYRLVSDGNRTRLDRPEAVVEYLKSAFDNYPTQEAFYVIFLNRRNHPLGRLLVTIGTLNSTLVSPREVFRGAILANAAAIIVAHNHPSGDPRPSGADHQVTRALKQAAGALEIDLLDHVIAGFPAADPTGAGFFSFKEAGQL